jgi:Ca2+-binding RTX toxin-like protein
VSPERGRRVSSFALVAVLLAAGLTAPADASPQGCTITGTDKDDHLTGTAGDDVICGLEGDDVISGGGGDDRLVGGPGRDIAAYPYAPQGIRASLHLGTATGAGDDTFEGIEGIDGSPFDDSLEGSPENDVLDGEKGNDTISGLGGEDVIDGGGEDDDVAGNLGNDRIEGGWGSDVLGGGYGRDSLYGGPGADRLLGNEDPDILVGDEDPDILTGGPGIDGCVQGVDHGRKIGCEAVAYASAGGLLLFEPSTRPVGFAYHESLFGSAIDLRPFGRVVDNENSARFSSPPRTDGPDYVVMYSRGRAPGATTATDVVVPSHATIVSPVDGTVVTVVRYRLYCESVDWKVVLQPSEFPSLRVLVLHMATPSVEVGDHVVASVSTLGTARENDMSSAQENRYFPDQYPHVHIEVERDGANPTPGCAL